MEQKITAIINQSLFDIALQESGTIESIYEVAIPNNLSPTDKIEPGAKIEVGQIVTVDKQVQEYYVRNRLSPASIRPNEIFTGIGYWKIGVDFKVS